MTSLDINANQGGLGGANQGGFGGVKQGGLGGANHGGLGGANLGGLGKANHGGLGLAGEECYMLARLGGEEPLARNRSGPDSVERVAWD